MLTEITLTQPIQTPITERAAAQLALELYGLNVTAKALPGEKDLNFRLTSGSGEYVLKIASPTEPKENLELQIAALEHIHSQCRWAAPSEPIAHVQRVIRTTSGEPISTIQTSAGLRLVYLLSFIPGKLWAHCNPHTPDLLRSLGHALGAVDGALGSFSHPAAQRQLKWDLSKANWIRDYLHYLSPNSTDVPEAEALAGDVIPAKASASGLVRRAIVEKWLHEYESTTQLKLKSLRQQVIYNDANDYNIVVAKPSEAPSPTLPRKSEFTREGGTAPSPVPTGEGWGGGRIALIDFGDILHNPLICDLAIACAYAMLDKADPLSAACEVVAGFHTALPLQEAELDVLFSLIAMRLSVSVTNAAWQSHIEPANTYLQISARPAWDLLTKFESIHPNLAHYRFRAACGLPAVPHSPRVVQWLTDHADEIGSLIKQNLKTCPKIYSDWSVGSLELGNPTEYDNAEKFTRKIWARMAEAGVAIAIGGYNHARPVYGGDAFRIPSNTGFEWRTVHIGLDIFMDAETPVFAPLDGTVHSFAFNDAKYDYGPCIVLKHEIGDWRLEIEGAQSPISPKHSLGNLQSLSFFTLYGHLTLDSLDGLYVGKPIKKGEQLAKMGPYPINGDWPPHLHFQLITDMLDKHGDFNGSCRPSQRDTWLSLCPDANLITQIPAHELHPQDISTRRSGGAESQKTFAPPLLRVKTSEEILAERKTRIGYNLSLSYKQKLHMVRGYKQWLYDVEGQRYLDGVNNVAHVGHSHPRVVRAGQQQMAVLNTNTRYLHELIVRYAERITATLPEPLRVCFFVNSGSEANELALRLARAHTRQKDMVVVDVGYHGNTTSIVDISPYKHNHKGGMGAPDWVHSVVMPDGYRGAHKADDPLAGSKYARHIAEAIEKIQDTPPHAQTESADVKWQPQRNIAGFIAESVLSCGGQIVLPQNYLREAYAITRAVGGVCIADEVQTGFGRIGSHFWAFQTQGVVPDIVTMGKPAGNGHPLGIVVTTPEIAASFNNGLEYFNTFGGNPVSCAIGLAVLDVIEDEGLQANALRVGNYLLDGLRQLQTQHELIGDVRGLGLFSGAELVRDRTTLVPATDEATYLVNRMKDHGILLSTDGPHENVIKIKPPLCFDEGNADFMLAMLDKVLREDF